MWSGCEIAQQRFELHIIKLYGWMNSATWTEEASSGLRKLETIPQNAEDETKTQNEQKGQVINYKREN